MKKTLFAAAIIGLALPATLHAAGTVDAAETEWYDALMAADGTRLDTLLADEFTYQHPTGNTYPKSELIAQFTSGNVTVETLGEVERTVRDMGEVFVVHGSNPIGGMLGGQPYEGLIRWVNVWQDTDDGFRLVHRNSEILPLN